MSSPDPEGARGSPRPEDLVYRAAFEHSLHATWILSLDGFILSANQRARNIMASGGPWQGSSAATAAFPKATVASRAALALTLAAAGEMPPPQTLIEDVDIGGVGRCHEVTVRTSHSASGEPLFVILEARDITEMRRVAAEAEAARRAAEAADRAKSVFLARMSHEMRTPLHAVLGFARLLLADPAFASGDPREAIEQIHAAGDHLLALVNDVLELARLESGSLTAETTPTDLTRLLRDLADHFATAAATRDLRFVVELDPALPEVVLVDARRLGRTLRDLLDNAVRYTTAGEVRLIAVWQPEGRRERLGLRVEDTGPGIPLADQERLLSPFESGRGGHSGTGLGLALARRLTLLMGGTFALHSRAVGTRIEIDLPTPRFEPGTAADLLAGSPEQTHPPTDPSLAACADLPETLRSELAAAAQIADHDRLKSCVQAIERVDPQTAAVLASAVDRYDYRALLEALGRQPAAASSSGPSSRTGDNAGSEVRRVNPSTASGGSGRAK